MEWFKVYKNLKDHPKRWRFEARAGTEYGLHYLTAFWCYVCAYKEQGSLDGVEPTELARACEWKGDPLVFWAALVHAGFIDETEEGVFVHDWIEIHDRFINENARRKKTQARPKGKPRETQGQPLLEEKRIEEKRKEEKDTETPSADAEASPSGFNFYGLVCKRITEEGGVITQRNGIDIGQCNTRGKKLGEEVFTQALEFYVSDKMMLKNGISIKGFLNALDRFAGLAVKEIEANKNRYVPPLDFF